MRKYQRPKKHGIYDTYTTGFLTIGLALGFMLSIGLSVFFVRRFLIEQHDPTVFLLLAIMLGPWVYIIAELIRCGLMLRLLLRLEIDSLGIHCYLFGRKRNSIMWKDIRTYGITGNSFSYISQRVLTFSLDKQEYAPHKPSELYRISESRLVIQYRTDVWNVLMRCMPEDMHKKLSYALSREQDCFHKR